MKKFINKIVSIVSLLYPYKLHQTILKRRTFLYTCWVQKEFIVVGEGTRFVPPLTTRGGKNIKIGKNCFFFRFCEINAWDSYKGYEYKPSITIGDDCQFGPNTHITCCNKIEIGNRVLTGGYVIISDNNHGSLTAEDLLLEPRKRKLTSKGEIVIGNNVWIGDKVAILSGVHIGDNAVIAANSVVTHNIPDCSIAAGVPAKIIKKII